MPMKILRRFSASVAHETTMRNSVNETWLTTMALSLFCEHLDPGQQEQ